MSNFKKCNGCGIPLTIGDTIHKSSCPTVPKCRSVKCNVRVDLWGIPHADDCEYGKFTVSKSNRTGLCEGFK